MSQQQNLISNQDSYRETFTLINHLKCISTFVLFWIYYESIQYIYYLSKGWKGCHQHRIILIVFFLAGISINEIRSYLCGDSKIFCDLVARITVLTLIFFEILIRFNLLGERFEYFFYVSFEFSGWHPRCVPGWEHARIQLRLASELEEEYNQRDFERRFARVCRRFGGEIDCDFIEAWIDKDCEVIEDIFIRKCQSGLRHPIADALTNKTLESYNELLSLRNFRSTALENLEDFRMVME